MSRPGDILALQRSLGNAAVQRRLRGGATRSPGATTGPGLLPEEEPTRLAPGRPNGRAGRDVAPATRRLAPALAAPAVQRSRGGRFLKAQIFGLNKTVNPFFGWKGDYKSLKDIAKGDDAAIKYGTTGGRVLNGMVATTDRVASLFTALAFILTGLGTILTAAAGTGAGVLAVASAFGVVATIAHAVTFLLRLIVTIYDGIRSRDQGLNARERALLKAKMWNNITGLIANGLGVVFGGLTGGLVVSGPLASAIGQSMGGVGTAAGDAAAAGATALAGEGANRLADTASAIGAISAHGLEKPYENGAGAQVPGPPPGPQGPGAQPPGAQPPGAQPPGAQMPGAQMPGAQMPGVPPPGPPPPVPQGPALDQSASEATGSESESQATDLAPILAELDQLILTAAELRGHFREQGDRQQAVVEDMNNAGPKMDELVGKNAELDTQAQSATAQLDNAVAEASATRGLQEKQLNRAQVEELEASVEGLEQQVGGADATEEESSEEAAPTAVAPRPRSRAASAPPTIGRKAPGLQATNGRRRGLHDPPPGLQRGVGQKIKGFFGRLAGRVLNLRKRIKKVAKKVKTKLMKLLIRVLGLRRPLQELQAEQVAGQADLAGAIEANRQSEAGATVVQQQLDQAKATLAETE